MTFNGIEWRIPSLESAIQILRRFNAQSQPLAAVKQATKQVLTEQKRIRIERELRKLNCLQREEERTGCKYNDMKSTNPETTTLIGWGQSK